MNRSMTAIADDSEIQIAVFAALAHGIDMMKAEIPHAAASGGHAAPVSFQHFSSQRERDCPAHARTVPGGVS